MQHRVPLFHGNREEAGREQQQAVGIRRAPGVVGGRHRVHEGRTALEDQRPELERVAEGNATVRSDQIEAVPAPGM